MTFFLLLLLITTVTAFYMPPRVATRIPLAAAGIEYQFDCGRGEQHLSAGLVEAEDLVVYQTGTWLVDGVEVGSGGPVEFEYALIDTLQLVWTHNCEHGVLRGMRVVPSEDGDCAALTDNQVEFGPEQLIAKVPFEWRDGDDETLHLQVKLPTEWEPVV